MTILEVYKENPNNELDSKSVGQFSISLICASYLASLPGGDLYTYRVTVWDNWDGDLAEDSWEHIESIWADEWLEQFIANGRYSNKAPEEYLLSVGTRVILPPNGKYPKHQKRLCVIDAIRPEKGREYAILRGITSRGVSKSDNQAIYMPFSQIETLEIRGKYLNYKPITKTTQ